MTRRDPSDVAILAARIQRAYPTLSPYSAASLAEELGAIERAQRRHATRQCNGGPAERKGDVPGYCKLIRRDGAIDSRAPKGMEWVHDPDAERKAGERIERKVEAWERRIADLVTVPACADWYRLPSEDKRALLDAFHKTYVIELQGDPRGAVLLVRFPGEAEAVSA